MASYEIVFPRHDDDGSVYTVREMAYCPEHSRCTHEPRPTGRMLQADGTWGDLRGTAAEFATLYEAEGALRRVQAGQDLPRYVPLVPRQTKSGAVEEVPAHQDETEESVDPLSEGARDFGHTSALVLRTRPGGGYDAALVDRETGAERPVELRPSDGSGWLHVAHVDPWGDVRSNACVWITHGEPLPGTPAWGEWYRAQTPGCECHYEPVRHCDAHSGPRDGCACSGCVASSAGAEAAP